MDDLENLLNLDGEIFPMDNGYLWRITDEKREDNKSWHYVKRAA